MATWQLSAIIHYWPGSSDADAKQIEIDGIFKGSQIEAGAQLDRVIREKQDELERQGFRTRYSEWSVKEM